MNRISRPEKKVKQILQYKVLRSRMFMVLWRDAVRWCSRLLPSFTWKLWKYLCSWFSVLCLLESSKVLWFSLFQNMLLCLLLFIWVTGIPHASFSSQLCVCLFNVFIDLCIVLICKRGNLLYLLLEEES